MTTCSNLKCEDLDLCKCGECGEAFCNEHLLYYTRPKGEAQFYCKICCDLFELERPSWEYAT